MKEINYLNKALTSNYNYYFIGLIIFLMLVFGGFWAWLYVLVAGEVAVCLFANTDLGKRYLSLASSKETEEELLDGEQELYKGLDNQHRKYIDQIRELCQSITKRNKNTDVLEKLAEFRYKYAVLLDEHYQLVKNKPSATAMKEIEVAIDECQKLLNTERSSNLRATTQTNLSLLRTRQTKLGRTGERVKEIEMNLEIVKNSLTLIYEDAITSGRDSDILSMVDNLVSTVEVDARSIDDYTIDDLRLPAPQPQQKAREQRYEQKSKI